MSSRFIFHSPSLMGIGTNSPPGLAGPLARASTKGMRGAAGKRKTTMTGSLKARKLA